MFRRIENGWFLAKSCYVVVLRDKTLVMFPILAILVLAVLLTAFAGSFWGQEFVAILERIEAETATDQEAIDAAVILVVGSVLFYFVIFFFHTALIYCAGRSIHGENTGVLEGIGMAILRLPHVIGWTLITVVVGSILSVLRMLLSSLKEKSKAGGIIADIVPDIVETAWSVLTYFVVPVMVFERTNPLSAVGRSRSLITKKWGLGLGGYFGIGLLSFILSIPFIILFVAGIFLLEPWMLIAAAGGCLLVSIFNETAKAVLCATLYHYATGRTVPPEFQGKLSFFFYRK